MLSSLSDKQCEAKYLMPISERENKRRLNKNSTFLQKDLSMNASTSIVCSLWNVNGNLENIKGEYLFNEVIDGLFNLPHYGQKLLPFLALNYLN